MIPMPLHMVVTDMEEHIRNGVDVPQWVVEEWLNAINSHLSPTSEHCMCIHCKGGNCHASDCAVHNEPAMPIGECDCGMRDKSP